MASVFEQIVDALHVELNDSALPYGVFRLSQQHHAAVRRVVWIPTTFLTNPITLANPRRTSDGDEQRALHQEAWSVECHITGDSMEDAETIRERLMTVCHALMHTSSHPDGGEWVTQGQQEAEVMYGAVQKVIQRFKWDINVLEPVWPHGVVDQVDTTVALQQPDAVVGDPPNAFDETLTVVAPTP